MYSTQKNINSHKPPECSSSVCGKHLFFTSKNINLSGGMRLAGQYKKSLQNKPLISVVTTVLNRATLIEKAICSVLSQTYDNIEYIIVDGGSTDGTIDKIVKYEDCIDYFISEPDGGLYEGMNKGLSLATGDYILILNSDDWYVGDCIEILVTELTNKNVELVSALAIETDLFGRQLRKIPPMAFKENTRFRMPLRHETMLISKDLYNKVGAYDTNYKVIADLKLTIKIYECIKTFYQVNEYLMYFRKIGIASEATPQLIDERKRLIGEQFPFLTKDDLSVLANDLPKGSHEYQNLLNKYKENTIFTKSLETFIDLKRF